MRGRISWDDLDYAQVEFGALMADLTSSAEAF